MVSCRVVPTSHVVPGHLPLPHAAFMWLVTNRMAPCSLYRVPSFLAYRGCVPLCRVGRVTSSCCYCSHSRPLPLLFLSQVLAEPSSGSRHLLCTPQLHSAHVALAYSPRVSSFVPCWSHSAAPAFPSSSSLASRSPKTHAASPHLAPPRRHGCFCHYYYMRERARSLGARVLPYHTRPAALPHGAAPPTCLFALVHAMARQARSWLYIFPRRSYCGRAWPCYHPSQCLPPHVRTLPLCSPMPGAPLPPSVRPEPPLPAWHRYAPHEQAAVGWLRSCHS